jgi:putative membrane protein
MMHWFNWMHGFGWGSWGWVGWILNLVIILGIIAGIVLLVVWLARQTGPISSSSTPRYPEQNQPTALEILQVRYARGEIDQEQYELMKRDLQWSR